jgi:hypothetical protein
MFNNNKSDFAATIGGFILVGFLALCLAVRTFDIKFDFVDYIVHDMSGVAFLITVVGVFCGIVCLYKAFLTEGFTFILVPLFAYATAGMDAALPVAIGFLIVFLIIGFMGFREGYLDLAIINGLFAVYAFAYLGFFYDAESFIFLFAGILMVLAAAVSFYVAVIEWMGAQDFIQEYEAAIFGCCCDDDDCCCGCEDDDCECGDDCTCHKN